MRKSTTKTRNHKLVAAIAKAGLRQCDVAALAGMSDTVLSGIVNGRINPTAGEIEVIRQALKSTPSRLGLA